MEQTATDDTSKNKKVERPAPELVSSAVSNAKKIRKKIGKSSKKRTPRPFPTRSLEESLKIPKAIREQNNGKPWATEDVARASLNVSRKANNFFYAAASARDYGLTIGTRDTEKIELAPLGKEIFFAGDESTRRKKMIEAFFSIDLFKTVYDHYGSAKLPAAEFLNNVLQNDFGLAPEFHSDFEKIFKENCEFLGIENGLDVEIKSSNTQRIEHPSDIRVIGEPKGKFDRTAFVIMPFVEKGPSPRPSGYFTEVLAQVITPAANSAGFSVETAEQSGSDVIQSTIIHQLLKADLVIADLTDHNPNVLFELGIRIAKEMPVALIKAGGTGQIFDVDNMMRVLSYNSNLWPSTVANDIPKMKDHIKATWDNFSTVGSYMKILAGVAKAA